MGEENKRRKAVSKFFRLKLADDIRKLVEGLPLSGLVETQIGNHVYVANGELNTGFCKHPVVLRIRRREDKLYVTLRLGRKSDIVLPFDTPDQRLGASGLLVQEICRMTN